MEKERIKAVKDFEREFLAILEKKDQNSVKVIDRKIKIGHKIKILTQFIQKFSVDWNKLGDDWVLSNISNSAGSIFEKFIQKEIEDIMQQNILNTRKMTELNDLCNIITEVSWLAGGFKTSLRLEIKFAQIRIKHEELRN